MGDGRESERKEAARRTGAWIRERMRARGWNGNDLAQAIGVGNSTVSRWIRGIQPPASRYCDLLADAFGVETDFVLTLAGHRPEVEPIESDDPKATIISLVKRVDLDRHDRAGFLEDTLRRWIKFDREHADEG